MELCQLMIATLEVVDRQPDVHELVRRVGRDELEGLIVLVLDGVVGHLVNCHPVGLVVGAFELPSLGSAVFPAAVVVGSHRIALHGMRLTVGSLDNHPTAVGEAAALELRSDVSVESLLEAAVGGIHIFVGHGDVGLIAEADIGELD